MLKEPAIRSQKDTCLTSLQYLWNDEPIFFAHFPPDKTGQVTVRKCGFFYRGNLIVLLVTES